MITEKSWPYLRTWMLARRYQSSLRMSHSIATEGLLVSFWLEGISFHLLRSSEPSPLLKLGRLNVFVRGTILLEKFFESSFMSDPAIYPSHRENLCSHFFE